MSILFVFLESEYSLACVSGCDKMNKKGRQKMYICGGEGSDKINYFLQQKQQEGWKNWREQIGWKSEQILKKDYTTQR